MVLGMGEGVVVDAVGVGVVEKGILPVQYVRR